MAKNTPLNQVVKALGYTQKKFAEKFGWTDNQVQYAQKTSLSLEMMRDIIREYPQISAEWLLTEEGPMYKVAAIELQIHDGEKADEVLLKKLEEAISTIEGLKAENAKLKVANAGLAKAIRAMNKL